MRSCMACGGLNLVGVVKVAIEAEHGEPRRVGRVEGVEVLEPERSA